MTEPEKPKPPPDPTRELHARQAFYCDDCGATCGNPMHGRLARLLGWTTHPGWDCDQGVRSGSR